MEAGLGHRDDVRGAVELAVAAPIEPHLLDLPRARRDRRDAGQGRESVGRSEPADITDLGDEPGDGDWTCTRQPQERVAGHEHADATRESLDLPLETREAQKESASELSLDPADTAQEPTDRRAMAGGNEVRDFPAIAWRQSEQMSVQSIACAG